MMKSFQAIGKQLFGAGYEQIGKSGFVCLLVGISLYAAEIRVAVAPTVLFLTATVFTGSVMWQALSSGKNAETMGGFFLLPFSRKSLTFAYTLAFSAHTILTKTALILTLFFAVGTWSLLERLLSLLCACTACLVTAGIYAMTGQKRTPLGIAWAAATIFPVLVIPQPVLIFSLMLANLSVAIFFLLTVDTFLFYRPKSAAVVRHFHGRAGVFTYLLRYLFTNKNYLVNTFGMWLIACFLPSLLGQFEAFTTLPMGFAILCLNTSICVLLSCDPDLEQALRVLPGQITRFCSKYCLFLFLIHMTTSGIYLCSWQLWYGGVTLLSVVTALLFAFQSALLSVALEWFYPLRKWKVESDLWHHPRKYIVPVLMLLFASLVGLWTDFLWVWLGFLPIVCWVLLGMAKKVSSEPKNPQK